MVFWEGLMVFWKVWWLSHVVYLYTGVRLSKWNGRVKCEMSGSDQTRKALNPFSHGVFFVYHLTGHIRHPYKDYISKYEDDSSVCVCVCPPEQVPPNSFKQSERGGIPRFSL